MALSSRGKITILISAVIVVAIAGVVGYFLSTGGFKLFASVAPELETLKIAGAQVELKAGDARMLNAPGSGFKSADLESFVIGDQAILSVNGYVEITANEIVIRGTVRADGARGRDGTSTLSEKEPKGGKGGDGSSGGGGGGVGGPEDGIYSDLARGGWGGGMLSRSFGADGEEGKRMGTAGLTGKGGAGSHFEAVQVAGAGIGGRPRGASNEEQRQGWGGDGATLSGTASGGAGGAGLAFLGDKTKADVFGGGGAGGGASGIKLIAKKKLIITGRISASGGAGGDAATNSDSTLSAGAGGGGGGGSIFIDASGAVTFDISGSLVADGGSGGVVKTQKNVQILGVGGGGGSIMIVTKENFVSNKNVVHATAGKGDYATGTDGEVKVVKSTLPVISAINFSATVQIGKTGSDEVKLTWDKPEFRQGYVVRGKIMRKEPRRTARDLSASVDFANEKEFVDTFARSGVAYTYRLYLWYEKTDDKTPGPVASQEVNVSSGVKITESATLTPTITRTLIFLNRTPSVTPTATVTNTNTPAATLTPTVTNTPVPPTNTATATPTP